MQQRGQFLAENTHDDDPFIILDPVRLLENRTTKKSTSILRFSLYSNRIKFHGSHEQHFSHIRPSILTGSKEPLRIVKLRSLSKHDGIGKDNTRKR